MSCVLVDLFASPIYTILLSPGTKYITFICQWKCLKSYDCLFPSSSKTTTHDHVLCTFNTQAACDSVSLNILQLHV